MTGDGELGHLRRSGIPGRRVDDLDRLQCQVRFVEVEEHQIALRCRRRSLNWRRNVSNRRLGFRLAAAEIDRQVDTESAWDLELTDRVENLTGEGDVLVVQQVP